MRRQTPGPPVTGVVSPRHSDAVDVVVVLAGQWPDDVERLRRDLPEWFGIEHRVQLLSARDTTRGHCRCVAGQ